MTVLSVRGLCLSAQAPLATGLSFDLNAGETLAIAGESGSGKSLTALAIMGLLPGAVRVTGGAICLGDIDLTQAPEDQLRLIRGDRIAMIFQEPLIIHGLPAPRAASEILLQKVGLLPEHLDRYPHEFSGGQRQRLCIARALVLNPALIVADEAVSALDVSVQARVLDLLKSIKAEFGIALLFISHDMAVVENIADRVAVMYLGQIMELGTRAQVFGNPQHAYTRRLLDAVPVPDPTHIRAAVPRPMGEVHSPVYPLGMAPTPARLRDAGAGHLVAV